jgi:hypothetical protein
VHPAALPGRTQQDRGDGLLEAGVRVGDHQLRAGQPPGLQRAQERRPERAVLRIADGEAEHLPVPVGGYPGGDDHRLGDHPPVDSGLAVGGVEEDVGKGMLGQAAVAEGGHFLIQVGADPGDLGLGDAGVGAQRAHQVVDLARGDAVQIGLHHHGEQRLVDPPAALQQRGEERLGAQLRDPQLQIPGRRSQRAWS